LIDWEPLFENSNLERIGPSLPEGIETPERLVDACTRAAGLEHFLGQANRDRATVTVVLNDPDRFTDSRLALDAVARILGEHRLDLDFRILFATGSHTYTPEQKRRHEKRILPRMFVEKGELAWHDASDPDLHRPVGDATLHRWVVGNEPILAVGSIEPHYFAGATGAHKTLTVGVMSYESLCKNHINALSADAKGLVLEGNPVFDKIAELVTQLSSDGRSVFAINEIFAKERLVGCTAGKPLDSLNQGLPLVRRIFSHTLSRAVDLVIARVCPPLDKSLYQADKGIKNVENAVRDGGVILLDAACHEGVGIDRFMKLLEKAPDHEKAVDLVRREGYCLGDHKAVRLRALTDRRRVRLGIFSTHLSESDARTAGLALHTDRAAAARWASRCLSADVRTAVIVEDAGNTTLTI
jgi:nickel-dependent lactate racemase